MNNHTDKYKININHEKLNYVEQKTIYTVVCVPEPLFLFVIDSIQ